MVESSVHAESESSGVLYPSTRVEEPEMNAEQGVEIKTSHHRGNESSSSSQYFQESVLLSPGFRSAAALAGWDAETLLMAALNPSPVHSGSQAGRGDGFPHSQDASESHAAVRKRESRSPLSSARRHRRGRWEGGSGSPLGRMKPLTQQPSDNELGNVRNESCQLTVQPAFESGATEGKENCHPNSSTCNGKVHLKGKEKQRTPGKPPCLDQLREELSCAVCLDICFEPSTISCGHSFCGTCLQSVLKKCGPRCPKCRQAMRSETVRNCRVNTVLWNTIQILFPKESSLRIQDQQRNRDEEAANKAASVEQERPRQLGMRPSLLEPWRSGSSFLNNVNRISVMGNLRSSFQLASELMVPSAQGGDGRATWISREERRGTSHTEENSAGTTTPRSQSRSRRRNRAAAAQSREDAVLAARLQAAELDEVAAREVINIPSLPNSRPRNSGSTVSSAAVASRPVRQHRGRTTRPSSLQ